MPGWSRSGLEGGDRAIVEGLQTAEPGLAVQVSQWLPAELRRTAAEEGAAAGLRGMERDIYFQVAMLTTVGLTSKNAILIVEFARENVQAGMDLVEATLRAVRDRLRPILMTSLAFGLGVLPLAFATGAGSGAQRAIGTGVLGGMLAGTMLGLFFTPLFFVVVRRIFARGERSRAELPSPARG